MIIEIVLALISLALLVGVFLCLRIAYIHRQYDHIPGPPRDSFFLGNIPAIDRDSTNGFFYNAIGKWFDEYGPIICIWLGTTPFITVKDLAIIKDVAVKKDLPKASRIYSMLMMMFKERSMGEGLVTILNKSKWKERRQMINPAFHRTYLKSLIPNFNKSANIMLGKLRDRADGTTVVNLMNEMHRVALDVIAKAAFGLNLNIILEHNDTFLQAADKMLFGFDFKISNPFFKFDFRTYGKQRECDEATKYIRDFGAKCIAERKKLLSEGKDLPPDIMSMVVERAVVDGKVSDEELVDECVTFSIAGQETTANTLSFLILAILSHPDIKARVVAEVEEVLGDKDEIEFDDLARLKYMGQCIKETLRMYPPVEDVDRETPEVMEYHGYKIPKGATIGISIYAVHHLPEYWPSPFLFNPDRWESEADQNPGITQAYMPFSSGSRNCIGRFFAEFEAKVVFAKLIQTFEMKLVPNTKIEIAETGTLRPKGGVPVTLTSKRVS